MPRSRAKTSTSPAVVAVENDLGVAVGDEPGPAGCSSARRCSEIVDLAVENERRAGIAALTIGSAASARKIDDRQAAVAKDRAEWLANLPAPNTRIVRAAVTQPIAHRRASLDVAWTERSESRRQFRTLAVRLPKVLRSIARQLRLSPCPSQAASRSNISRRARPPPVSIARW